MNVRRFRDGRGELGVLGKDPGCLHAWAAVEFLSGVEVDLVADCLGWGVLVDVAVECCT
jgi:hypothetical protein